jgi:hypothetical protein
MPYADRGLPGYVVTNPKPITNPSEPTGNIPGPVDMIERAGASESEETWLTAGYALLLTHSFNWWFKSSVFKAIGVGLLVIGILLVWLGRSGTWKKRFGSVFLLLAATGLIAVFATDLFRIGKGRPVFVYNFLDLERFRWEGLSSVDGGKHTIVFDFKYDGPGPAKGGTGVLSVDGKEVARKTIPHTIPLLMSIDETFDIGLDTRTPVDFTYDVPFRFTGTIDKLNYRLGPEQLSAEDKRKAAVMLAAAKD